MRPSPLRTVVLAALLAATSGSALADCTDVPQPGVYWRRCLQDGQDLREVDLTGATLRDASFNRTDLSDATMIEADARRAKFVSAVMRNAQLDRVRLVRADLTKADLTGASLKQADLTNARLFRADLSEADLTGAHLEGTDLLKANLSGAIWIDGVTICAEGSLGQCNPGHKRREVSGAKASG